MASHPSATKRLGAALAINSIYSVFRSVYNYRAFPYKAIFSFFREEEALVDTFVMEMLVVMINSLKLAHRDKSSLGEKMSLCWYTWFFCVTIQRCTLLYCTVLYVLHVVVYCIVMCACLSLLQTAFTYYYYYIIFIV